jgi:hypothetical protein
MRVADRRWLCHLTSMSKPTTRAGGFFLAVIILVGFAVGIAIGSPITGVIIGTAIGIAAALLTWLGDRRRPRL